MRTFAAELVSLNPDVILTQSTAAIAAMKAATTSIPTVFVVVNDPVAQGYVPNVSHPGGNITGFSYMDYSVLGKALGLLKETHQVSRELGLSSIRTTIPITRFISPRCRPSRQTLGVDVTAMRVHSDAEIEDAVDKAAAEPGGSLLAAPSAFVGAHRRKIIESAAMRP